LSYIPGNSLGGASVLADLSIWHILILVAVITLLFGTSDTRDRQIESGGIQEFKPA